MKVFFKPSFIKDFKKLPQEIKKEIKNICFDIFPVLQNLKDFSVYNIKAMRGFKHYYRIKLKEYRIGLKKENGSIIFIRIKHRKDIYKHFP